jgi:hypothetical protein
MKNETPKVTTPITATDILAVAAKSEVVPTVLTRHHSIDTTKIEKNWYVERTEVTRPLGAHWDLRKFF